MKQKSQLNKLVLIDDSDGGKSDAKYRKDSLSELRICVSLDKIKVFSI